MTTTATDPIRTLWESADNRVFTLDQTRLPFEQVEIELASLQDCARAIATMQVRGAPLIGAVGAYGMAWAIGQDPSDDAVKAAFDKLFDTRPTAVNLRWALERMANKVTPVAPHDRAAVAWEEARHICTEDIQCNRDIGMHTLPLLRPMMKSDKPLQILTHCNAGRLATVALGTATAPIYLMAEQGLDVHVWVDETRPRNQGASLTAWELAQAGIAHTVIADNAGGLLMMRGEVDVVVLGCDRVAANGDVVNKIGTYLKALAARAHDVPFYVACPTSTIDMRCASGPDIPIEYRDSRELTHINGVTSQGEFTNVRLVPERSVGLNPAFDITPASLVSALITESGVCEANIESISKLGLAS